ncbi:hypothetical protein [Winogradskyella sp. A2]|uniref:hypothetical protein n=1 Tax=Winogradskyella sp. A2 TaxID=3366944 RepID=UPI00398C566E
MTKRILLFLSFFTLLFNCSITEKPQFIGLNNIKVIDANADAITLSTDAMFKNPNDVGGKLKTDGLRVYINETEVATIVSEEFDVPSKNDFTIPLIVSVATDSLVDKNSLGGLISSLISQQLKVRYNGEIDYKVFGYSSSYTIDEEQIIKVKL